MTSITINTHYGKAKIVHYNNSDYLDVFMGSSLNDFVGQLDINYWYTSDDETAKAIERMIG